MHSPFISGSKHLLKSWKALRGSMTSELSDLDHLKMVCQFWSKAPLGPHAIDWDRPSAWPDPWQLVSSAEFDESSVALAMFYTLHLSEDGRWDGARLRLMLVRDPYRSVQRIVLSVDDRWLLNLDYNTVLDTNTEVVSHHIQQRYAYDGKIHSVLEASYRDSVINEKPDKMLSHGS